MKKTVSLVLSVFMILSLVTMGAFSVSAEEVTLIEAGSEWSYYDTREDDTLPENWNTTGFDVSAWEKSLAPFGNSWSSGHNTSIEQGEVGIQVCFVKTFEVSDPAAFEALYLGFYYDENPVVYLNGVEVLTKSGYNTSLAEFDFTDAKEHLVKGTNTIAVLMKNASTGYGFNFDLSLKGGAAAEPLPAINEDGTINFVSIEKVGFSDFGNVNKVENLLDGDVNSCSGSGRNMDAEQGFIFTIIEEVEITQIYLQCKGYEDNVQTSHEDGVTFGYYDIYIGDELVADDVPAVSAMDGGSTVTFENPIKGTTIKVMLDGEWYASNWANLADIVVRNEAVEEDPVDPPSGEDPVGPPSGEDPVDPPSGEDPVDPPSGEDPVDPDKDETPSTDNETTGDDTTGDDNTDTAEDEGGFPIWIIVVIGVVAAVIIVAVLFIPGKKKD